MSANSKKKVFILGAGPAGLAAAWGLSSSEELRAQYEITLFQAGHRAGGKCATGRAPSHNQVEQNCAHYLFGCYDNTFALAREAYSELPGNEWGNFDSVLLPRNLIALKQKFKGKWTDWLIEFPANTATPGKTDGEFPPMHDYLIMMLEAVLEGLFGWKLVAKINRLVNQNTTHKASRRSDIAHSWLERGVHGIAALAVRALLGISKSRRAVSLLDRLIILTLRFVRWCIWQFDKQHVDDDLHRLRRWTLADYSLTSVIGLLSDKLLQPGGFEGIDHLDYREWLLSHGATHYATESPFVTLWYQNSLAYRNGNISDPAMSAGIAMLGLMRAAFTYKGNVAYSLKDEVADSFLAPMFLALKNRGVNFKFFHRVRDLKAGANGKLCNKLVVEQQIELASGNANDYNPLIQTNGGYYWPVRPNSEQFSKADRERFGSGKGEENNLESFYTTWRGDDQVFYHGVDFDDVIYAMPHYVMPAYAADFFNSPGNPVWRDLYNNNPGPESQSLRLWFRDSLEQIGWPYPAPILSGYTVPFFTWEDDSQLLASENWNVTDKPATIACVFGPLQAPEFAPPADDTDYPETQRAIVDDAVAVFTTELASGIWPTVGSASCPNGIDPAKLVASAARANCGPLERYTMTWPGALKTRPTVDQSGVDNVYFAGDWVRNGLEAGSMEGATMAGLQASRAICGYPQKIIGERNSWL